MTNLMMEADAAWEKFLSERPDVAAKVRADALTCVRFRAVFLAGFAAGLAFERNEPIRWDGVSPAIENNGAGENGGLHV